LGWSGEPDLHVVTFTAELMSLARRSPSTLSVGRIDTVTAHDFKFERGQSFGEWLHREMHEAVRFAAATWLSSHSGSSADAGEASGSQEK
jgi:hypothetical protein